MKAGLKKLVWVLGGLCSALLILLVLAMTSPVQTWVARKVLANQPELGAEIGQVRVGWHQLNLEQGKFELSGAVLTLPQLQADFPVVAAAWKHEVAITKLVARGWTLDLTRYTPKVTKTAANAAHRADFSRISTAHAAAVPVPSLSDAFAGVFAQLELPVDLSLDGAILEGEVIVPAGPGNKPVTLRVSLLGGGLQAGHNGVFNIDAQTDLTGMGGPVDRLKVGGTVSALMDSPRTFAKFFADLNSQAVGGAFPQGVQLSAELSAAKINGGEDYALTLQTVGKRLLDVQANLPENASRFGGVWRVDMRDTDVAPFVLGRSLPTFEAVGAGMFETDTLFAEIHTAGRIKTTLDRLEVVIPSLAEVGAVTLFSEFDLTQMDAVSRVDKLKIDINHPQPVLGIAALQAFEFNLASGELKVADPTADLLAVEVQDLPVEWVGPLVDPVALQQGRINGRLVASARDGGVEVHTVEGLRIGNLSVSHEGQALAEALDLTLCLLAEYGPSGWQVALDNLKVDSAGANIATLKLKAGQLIGSDQPIKASVSLQVGLVPLLRQPILRDEVAVSKGKFAADILLTLSEASEVQGKFSLSELADVAGTVLPNIAGSIQAGLGANGEITFNLPLQMTMGPRVSDPGIKGTLTPQAAGYHLAGQLNGKKIYLSDMQLLAGLAAVPTTLKEAAAPEVDAPFWAGLSGVIDLAITQLHYDEYFELKDVAGEVRINEGALTLDNVHAGIGNKGAMKLDGALTYVPEMKTPYALRTELAAREFDSAPFFKAYDARNPAQIDGRFNLNSTLTSQGRDLEKLAANIGGDVKLTSTAGVFRLLSANVSNQVEHVGKVAAVGAFLGNVVGALGINKDVTGLASKAQAVAELSQLLTAIKYDQLNVAVNRDADLNTNLREFALIAPEMRLSGDGQLRYQDDLDFMNQPLNLALEMKARGRTADVLRYLNLLATEKDDLGYAVCTLPLRVTGTLLKPDTSELKNALVKVAMESGGASDLLNRLLGK